MGSSNRRPSYGEATIERSSSGGSADGSRGLKRSSSGGRDGGSAGGGGTLKRRSSSGGITCATINDLALVEYMVTGVKKSDSQKDRPGVHSINKLARGRKIVLNFLRDNVTDCMDVKYSSSGQKAVMDAIYARLKKHYPGLSCSLPDTYGRVPVCRYLAKLHNTRRARLRRKQNVKVDLQVSDGEQGGSDGEMGAGGDVRGSASDTEQQDSGDDEGVDGHDSGDVSEG